MQFSKLGPRRVLLKPYRAAQPSPLQPTYEIEKDLPSAGREVTSRRRASPPPGSRISIAWQPRSHTNRQRQRGLHEWRLFPISRRVAGLTSAPCRSWRSMSRRAPSWAGWFWSTRLARSRSGKSYEVTGLCILHLRFRSKTCQPAPRLYVRPLALDIFISPIKSSASSVLIVIYRFRFTRFSVVRWECFVCFSGTRDGTGRILLTVVSSEIRRESSSMARHRLSACDRPVRVGGPKDGQAQPRLTAGCCG